MKALLVAAALTMAGALPGRGVAAQAPEAATFYFVVGNDTVVMERMTRTPEHLTFQLYDTKRFGKIEFAGQLDPSAMVRSADVRIFASDRDTAPAVHVAATFSGDSVGISTGPSTNWVHVGENAVPQVNPSPSLYEQLLLRAKAIGGASAQLSMMMLPSGPDIPATVTWIGADSAVAQFAGVVIRMAVSPSGRLLGGFIPAQNARILRGPATSAFVATRKSYAAPPGAPYSAQEVVVRTKSGLKLTGTLTLPMGTPPGGLPAMVTITGSGSQDRDEGVPSLPKYGLYRQLADTLGRRGIAVLRLDDRGVGGSDTGPLTATTADFADDIRAGVAYLRTRPEIDPRRIGVVGHSEGASIGPMVAESDSEIAAVVIMAGTVSTGRSIVNFQQHYVVDSMAHLVGQQRDAALAQFARTTDSLAIAVPWWGFFLTYDGTATAARVHAPVLIVHGARDYQVPVAEAEKTAAAVRSGGNRDVTVRVFPATNHLFTDDGGVGFSYEKLTNFDVRPEVLGAIADWLAARFKP